MGAARAGCLGAFLLCTALCPGLAQAQGAIFEQPRPGDRRLDLPALPEAAPEGRFELPPVPPPPADAPLSSGVGFVLQGVRFEGNRAVPTADLAAVAAPWLGQPVGTEELEALRRALTNLYVERGYINSGAVLPDQRVADGTVAFLLVEGELSSIAVAGAQRLRPGYVEERLAQGAGPPLNVQDLQRRFRILLDDPLIERLDAELAPGVRPGDSELRVQVQESEPVLLTVSAANNRSPSVGGEALEAFLLLRSPTGWGETLHARYARASGLDDAELGFSFPLNAHDTRLGMRAQITDSEVVEKPFSLLDVVSKSSEIELRLSHPLYRGIGQELQVSLLGQRRRTETGLLGRRFSFSEGVQDGRSTVTVLRLVGEWLDRSQDQVLALRGTASWGIDALGATDSPDGLPDGDFFAVLLQAQYVRRLGLLDTSLVARLDGQFSNDRLLPLEKFAVGGVNTVRGYRENTLVRDNGVVGSLELRVPVWQIRLPGIGDAPGAGQVELAPFVDAGRSWDNGPAANPSPTSLSSYGIGLRWAPAEHMRGFVYVARRLRDIDDPADSDRQDHGIHFRFSIDLL